ncbi:geranylgeranylglycerol-phosphate geranylgeranyltransferase [Halopiger djelfimassiliensis]|uniref:geranylgeranylglycerol-phosphate geranylgeranyltransferase n=1 Tax=Halopiger djelfimassiliensis TaxID=1293047 RepID=UPI0006779876|nr:geranylgeranylglycerol-phosphate geranylgeranyltransferase [Halopiger djelfimassiliensis]
MTAGETIRGLVELTRPVNVIAASVLTFIGAFVAGGVTDQSLEVAAAVGATGLAVGAGNAINDYFDREIDRINQPERAIPRGAVSPRGALAFSVVLFVIAVALAVTLLPLAAIAIAGINLVALVAYTEVFKGLPGLGNALVAYLVGSTFLFGAASVGEIGPAVVLFVLAAIATLTREIVKDVEDVEGDREEGLNTLPIAIGERRALVVAGGLLVLAVLASPIPYVLGYFGGTYLLVVVPADVLMLGGAYESFENPTAGQARLKYGMFLAALAFIVGRTALEFGAL